MTPTSHPLDLIPAQGSGPITDFAMLQVLEQRRRDLVEFQGQYEHLVEILCDGAQYGPEGALERRYQEIREWMQKHYRRVRRYVMAFLQMEPDPTARRTEIPGRGQDAFEALFHPATLDEFLRGDDGQMIHRITATRTAIERYSDHLSQLAMAV